MSDRFLRVCGKWTCLVLVPVALAGSPRTAAATEDDLNKLPVTEPFSCATCHVEQDPLLDRTLNVFGLDFLENGRKWDAQLAQLDSDLDGCLNGFEVGDSDGNGNADINVVEQAGNPGLPGDCGAEAFVDEKTWGTLKAMFDGQ